MSVIQMLTNRCSATMCHVPCQPTGGLQNPPTGRCAHIERQVGENFKFLADNTGIRIN